eukprot:SAG11_NODE_10129_length_852_cov_3.328021_1_plen_153_part_00
MTSKGICCAAHAEAIVLRMDLAESWRLPGSSRTPARSRRRLFAVMRVATSPTPAPTKRKFGYSRRARRTPAKTSARGCCGSAGAGIERAGRKAARAYDNVFHWQMVLKSIDYVLVPISGDIKQCIHRTTWASNSGGKRDSKVLRTDLEKRLW